MMKKENLRVLKRVKVQKRKSDIKKMREYALAKGCAGGCGGCGGCGR